jgi:hypothetical protein
MDLLAALWPYAIGSGGLVGLFMLMFRWIMRVEKGFGEQQVMNAKLVGALELLTEKLNGHAALDDARFATPVARRARRR